MKKQFIAIAVVIMALMTLMTSCDKVPDAKIEEVGTLYEELGTKYSTLVDFCTANGITDDADTAQSLSDYGVAISEYGTEISEKLESMKEEEVDTLIADLKDAIAQIDEIYTTYKTAVEAAA